MPYQIWQKLDYDEEFKLYGEELSCYSPKQMKELYPDKDAYTVLGEIRNKNKKKYVEKIMIGDKPRKVAKPGAFSRLFNKKVGYLCVGEDQYILVLKSRLLFILLFFGLGVGIALLGALLWGLLQPEPAVPDHPMPEPDQYIQTLPDDSGETAPPPDDGGGTVSMIYMLEAELSLSSGKIEMYFQNPAASNHDVTIEMLVVSGENQYPIAQSGRLPAGTGLYTMELIPGSAALSEGTYLCLYKVSYYNPVTGEKALVESDITDVTLTVTP